MYELFHTRYNLHKRAYQHRVARIIEHMLTEALVLANDHFQVPGTAGKPTRMSEAIDDMVAYGRMTDAILWQLYNTTSSELAPSRKLIDRVLKRQAHGQICHNSEP